MSEFSENVLKLLETYVESWKKLVDHSIETGDTDLSQDAVESHKKFVELMVKAFEETS